MIAFALSAALVVAVAGAYAHGHALGVRRGEAETFAFLEAKARRLQRTLGDAAQGCSTLTFDLT